MNMEPIDPDVVDELIDDYRRSCGPRIVPLRLLFAMIGRIDEASRLREQVRRIVEAPDLRDDTWRDALLVLLDPSRSETS